MRTAIDVCIATVVCPSLEAGDTGLTDRWVLSQVAAVGQGRAGPEAREAAFDVCAGGVRWR